MSAADNKSIIKHPNENYHLSVVIQTIQIYVFYTQQTEIE